MKSGLPPDPHVEPSRTCDSPAVLHPLPVTDDTVLCTCVFVFVRLERTCVCESEKWQRRPRPGSSCGNGAEVSDIAIPHPKKTPTTTPPCIKPHKVEYVAVQPHGSGREAASLYALRFYSSGARGGHFLSLSEVPSEKRGRSGSSTVWGGADPRSVLLNAVLRVWGQGLEAASRPNPSECTPGLDRPLCNYGFFLFNIYLTTLESLS